ncbi:hypothetical protein COOONC_01751 [Cooperia oncophora]
MVSVYWMWSTGDIEAKQNVSVGWVTIVISGSMNAPLLMTPIVPVNARQRRHSANFYQRGAQCCEGPPVETRPCSAACERRAPCAWTDWGEWCGCSGCRAGKEVRRRSCERVNTEGGKTSSEIACTCPERDTDERECIVDKNCDSYQPPKGQASAQDYGKALVALV